MANVWCNMPWTVKLGSQSSGADQPDFGEHGAKEVTNVFRAVNGSLVGLLVGGQQNSFGGTLVSKDHDQSSNHVSLVKIGITPGVATNNA